MFFLNWNRVFYHTKRTEDSCSLVHTQMSFSFRKEKTVGLPGYITVSACLQRGLLWKKVAIEDHDLEKIYIPLEKSWLRPCFNKPSPSSSSWGLNLAHVGMEMVFCSRVPVHSEFYRLTPSAFICSFASEAWLSLATQPQPEAQRKHIWFMPSENEHQHKHKHRHKNMMFTNYKAGWSSVRDSANMAEETLKCRVLLFFLLLRRRKRKRQQKRRQTKRFWVRDI